MSTKMRKELPVLVLEKATPRLSRPGELKPTSIAWVQIYRTDSMRGAHYNALMLPPQAFSPVISYLCFHYPEVQYWIAEPVTHG